MRFEDLKLNHNLLNAVRTEGYTQPTPIQEQAIPHVLAGKDLLGCAQTGTGKTAAFALPLLQRLAASGNGNGRRPIRTLVLAPTRELANQIGESFRAYGRHTGLKVAVIYGGVGQNPQVQALKRGVDILVATPGRLLDLIGQGHVHLEHAEALVLDEADRMLDMGFIHDVRRVVKVLPKQRQTLLFSATMPRDIQELADAILVDPVQVSVAPPTMTVEETKQAVYFVEKSSKIELLQHLLDDPAVTRVLVFTRTKHGANRVVKQLSRARVAAEPIHGNKSQTARERALANFKSGRTRVLVATDIAARGIDVEDITHVINYDLPNEPETYVHRIGRTGRAGASGIALSFCSVDERAYLKDIERLIRQHVAVVDGHPYISTQAPAAPAKSEGRRRQHTKPQNGKTNGNSRSSCNRNKQNRAGAQQTQGHASSASRQPANRHQRSAPKPAPSSDERRPPRLIR
ncbi:MAG: DEAD/DEAH box helicase [Anaerolineae bacterium]|nr:DEAD/DEAH box helicase [Anaerolineae bacterium]